MPINPWLEEKLAQHGGSVISVILEVPTSHESLALNTVSSLRPPTSTPELAGVGIVSSISHIAGTSFITTKIDSSQIGALSKIGTVHYNMPRSVGFVPCLFCQKKQTMTASTPVEDIFLGKIGVSRVEVPSSRETILQDMKNPSDYIFVPTGTLIEKMRDNSQSQSMRGFPVAVGIIDTGFLPPLAHPQINLRPDFIYSLIDEPPIDQHGHGCLAGKSKVYTQKYGLISLEEIWHKTNSEILYDNKGEYKLTYDKTISKDGITTVKAIYRTKSNKKVIINTPHNTIELTTWHKMFTCSANKDSDNKRRWHKGVKTIATEAKFVRPFGDSNLNGDCLLNSNYYGYSWYKDLIEPEIAYLHGLWYGDGHTHYRKPRYYEIGISDESKDFLETVSSIYGGTVIPCKDENCYDLNIYSRTISRTMEHLSLDKIFKDIELLRAWLAGFYDAEGYVNIESNRTNICNTELDLLTKLRNILNIIGIPCEINYAGESKGSISYHLDFYIPETLLSFIGDYCIKKKAALQMITGKREYGKVIKYYDSTICTPVKGVKFVDCDQYFYDLTTDAENYCSEGFIVHNSWCSFAATGSPFPHPTYGLVQGVADLSLPFHFKALNKDGQGDDSTVLKAMEMASNSGCKVVSMSLGGDAQGGVDDDPSSKVIHTLADKGMIFVIAAGNQGAPYTINSPGICPRAITVGSLSYTDKDVSWFSSQGPQSAWYANHPDSYDTDYNKYGDDLIKPDVMAVGGGRSANAPSGAKDEVLFNGSVGWFSSYYTGVYDGFGAMHGSSQATPQVAGLAACLVGAGIINNVTDFKKLLIKTYSDKAKSEITGYGEAKFSRFTG